MPFSSALPLILLLELMAIIYGIATYGWTLEGLQAVTRFSGRVSLGVFSAIFLFHKHPFLNVRRLLSNKFFLAFAVAHGIHLFEVLSYLYFSGAQPVWTRAIGGMIAYAFIFTMPWLHNRWESQQLSTKRYQQAVLVYLYYVWFIFFMTYLPRVRGTVTDVGGSYKEFVILLGWLSIMMGFKWAEIIRIKN